MSKKTIEVNHFPRIEGHGNVHFKIENEKLCSVEMNIVEPARLFEAMVLGRDFSEISYISSRICGICSASHAVTSLRAIEQIFNIEVSERTLALRELLIYGSFLQNHATHLFVLAAPDYLKMPSILGLAGTDKELLTKALKLKALGNELCTKIGGRSIHPITAVTGGFTDEISSVDYKQMAYKLEDMVEFAEQSVDLFESFNCYDIKSQNAMIAMYDEARYNVCDSEKIAIYGEDKVFDCIDYKDHLEEYVLDHSAAFASRLKDSKRPYMTGALARINTSWDKLSSRAKISAAKIGLRPAELNSFKNNHAQAIELVDSLDRCSKLAQALSDPSFGGSSKPVKYEICAGRGVGYTEAPRGVVLHDITLDDEGKVEAACIVTPTSQNIAATEADICILVNSMLEKGFEIEDIRLEVEKLVRAYDPCLSCSVH